MKTRLTTLIVLQLAIFSGCSDFKAKKVSYFNSDFLLLCDHLGIDTEGSLKVIVMANNQCVSCKESVYQRIEKSRIDKNSSPIILLLPKEFNSKEEKSKLSNCDQVSNPKISDCFEYSLEDMRRYGLVHSFGVWVEIENGEIIFQEGIFLD
ncbi:MAG: hypothetical protein SchgKO_03850 [Schleiferiaceae bacterium]